jgi:hypothetical protein
MDGAELEPLRQFLCVYEARLEGLGQSHYQLGQQMEGQLARPIVALNSNYHREALPGYERFLKEPKARAPAAAPGLPNRRRRQPQGNGSCINSAVEPVVYVGEQDYKMKCFPTTGVTQVPGVRREDCADGRAAVEAWVHFLNERGLGRRKVEIASTRVLLLNYKTAVCTAPGESLDLEALAGALEDAEGPFRVKVVNRACESRKMTVQLVVPCDRRAGGEKCVRVAFFPSGKINFQGLFCREHADQIYDWLAALFAQERARLVVTPPEPDAEDSADDEDDQLGELDGPDGNA